MSSNLKIKRSLKLICEFYGGYAKDWFFAVGNCFKDQMDIKYTEVSKKSIKTMKWTQGPFYCFDQGHVLYDTPKAYLIWSKALKYLKFRCEVIRGTPNHLDDKIPNELSLFYQDGKGTWWAKKRKKHKNEKSYPVMIGHSIEKYILGSVTFILSRPNKTKTGLEPIGQYHCSQFQFIDFLKTGKNDHIDINLKG